MILETAIIAAAGKFVLEAVSTHAISKASEIGWGEASRRIKNAQAGGQLPPNHVLERAVLRSAVLATLYCLDDAVAQAMETPSERDRNWLDRRAPRVRAQAWLKQTQSRLHHSEVRQTTRQRTINELLSGANGTIRPSAEQAVIRVAGLSEALFAGVDAGDAPNDPGSEHKETLNTLAAHIIRKVIAAGKWSDAEHANEQLTAACANEDHRWSHAFAHFFAQELKDDNELFVIVQITQQANLRLELHELKDQFADALEKTNAQIADRIDKLRHKLTPSIEEWALENMFQRPERRRQESDQNFHFSLEFDDFIGRDADIETIEAELFDSEKGRNAPFRWMAVCGDGGSGKSRLCHKLLERAPLWGFSNAGFASGSFISDKDMVPHVAKHVDHDTFLVIDYSTHSLGRLHHFLTDIARLAGMPGRPRIRVIVILRNPKDPFFTRLASISKRDDGGVVVDCEARKENRLTLSPLSEDDTAELMCRRMELVRKESNRPAGPIDKKKLIALLKKFDESMRPLFALMVAELALETDLDDLRLKKTREEARLNLFGAYLKRQRTQFWSKRLETIEPKLRRDDLERHENAVRIATALTGIDITQYNELQGRAGDLGCLLPAHKRRPDPDSMHADLVHSITGRPLRTDDPNKAGERIAPLEPDLIGECFVINGQDLSDNRNCALSLEEVIALSYKHDPDQTLFFLRLAIQDYPKILAARNFLLPEIGK